MVLGGSDMTKVTVALPRITDSLGMSSVESLWAADVYALAAGVMLVPSAVAADRYGRKRIYLLGLAVALVSALGAGLAAHPLALFIARAGQGVGSAMLIAGTVAIIRVDFPGSRRVMAYGVWTASFSIGAALGPLLGGSLVALAPWQSVFWVNVPVLGMCLAVASSALRESTNPNPPTLDPRSALYAAVSIGMLIGGLKGLAQPSASQSLSIGAVAVGGVVSLLFVRRQLRLSRPFLDLRLFRHRLLAVAAVMIAVTNGVFNGVLYLLTQRFQVVDGLTAIEAGLALIPLAAISAVGGVAGPLLRRRFTSERVLMAGVSLAATGFFLVGFTEEVGTSAGMATVALGMATLGLGAGIIMAIGADAVMSSAPSERTSDAGAIQESAFAVGAGSGVAVLGSASIYLGARAEGGPSAETTYGVGADAALMLAAICYVLFALLACIHLPGHDSPSSTRRASSLRRRGPRRAQGVVRDSSDRPWAPVAPGSRSLEGVTVHQVHCTARRARRRDDPCRNPS